MHFSGRVKNLVSHFLSVPAGVRGVVLFALMFFTGMGNVWGETYTYSSDTTITSSNFADGDTIIINNNATLTINLMVPNVTVANIFIGKDGSAGNLLINGPGTLKVSNLFDPDEKVKNRIKINNYANLVVTGTFYVDKGYGAAADAVTIITGDRTGSLSITGNVNYSGKIDSGVFFDTVNVNVLSDIDNLVKYSWDKMKASSEGIGITVERTFKGQAKKEKIFYKVVFSHSTRADINGSVEFAEKTSGTESTESKDIPIEFNNNPEGEHDFENTGDSAKLILYAPDGVTELETVAYYYQRPVWNGSESDDGYDVKNWGLAAGTDVSELLKFFKSNQIMLNSDLPRYPVFGVAGKSVEFKSLVVSSGASVTVSAGELIAGKLSVKGSGVLNTNGGELTISGNSTISNLNLGSAMKVTGGTTVITSLKTNGDCSVEISSGAEVYVTNSYLGENCSGKLSWTGTGALTIPRSGANVDFGAEVPDYGARLDVKAAGAATYYSANDLTADGSLILTRVSGSSTGTVAVEYPYTLSTDSTNPVTIDENTYNKTSGTSGKLVVPKEVTSKSFTVSGLSGINSGCSFIMTIYSPDGKFSLGSISYTKTSSGYLWTGNSSSDWSVRDNWSGLDASEQPDRMAGKTLIVDYANFTGNKKYPNINNTSTAGTIIIKNGAYITANNNIELTVGKILCMGDAYFSATQGCVIFSDDVIPSDDVIFSDDASFTAANPDNSKFNNVKIDGNFTANSKMSVDKNFSAENLGGKKIILNDNVIVGGNLFLSGNKTGMLNITGNAVVGNFSTEGNAVFAGNLTASGTISVSGTTQFKGNEISISSGGTQTFTGKVTVNSDVELVAGTSVAASSVIFNSTVDDGATSDSERHSIVIGSTSVKSSAVFNGTVGGTSKLKKLQVNGSASGNGADTIVINSENSSFAAFKDGTNLTVNGNADIYGDNTFTSFKLTGNAEIYGDNTFTSFTLTGNAVIYGSNTFTNIVIDNSGATAETTVKFKNGTTQTIQNDWSGGNIPFKGAGEGKELVLTSIEPFISETPNPWNVVFTNSDISNKNFSYVKVQNSKSVNSIASANPLKLLQKKENVVSAGNTFDWFRKTIYKWLGTEDTKWNNKDNWKDENNSPVSDVPDYATGTNEIIIDEASVNSLVFDVDFSEGTELKLKSLKIPSSKKVCIADCYVTADSITVDGTIALFGTQTEYPLGVNGGKVDWGADSTIEYYGSSAGAKDILCASVDSETGTQKYQNIKLSCGSIKFEKALDVAGNFTNDSAGQITFADNVKAASPVNFASSVKLSGNVIFDVPAVTFKSAFNEGLISEDSAREIVFTGKVSSEGEFTAAAGITEFKGNVDFSGSNFIHNGGTVKISGTDNLLTVKTDGSTVFNNLTANSSKTTLNGAFSVIRDFLVETDVECEMNGALTISGNFTNNGTYKAGKSDSDSYELKIAKDFVNNGSFDAKSGTVLFTGTENSNISGETKWFNFKAETPGKTLIFQAGKIQEILNSLIIKGSASDDKSSNVVLKSSTDGEFWFIKTAVNDSNLSVDYASIKDSKCTEKSIVANNSDDLGNTSGWIFPGLLYTWVGNESDLWSVSKNWSPASLPGKLSRVLIPDGKVIKADMDIEIQKLDLKPKSTFDLASHKITINGSDNYLTNEGTIKLNGIENQVEAAVKNLPDSWIEYYGGTAENPSKNVIKEEYYNLKIYSDADFDNLSDNTDIPVIINGNLVLAESAKMTFEKNVQICGDLIENGNNLVLKGNFEVANVQSENGKHISITFNGPVAGKTEQILYYSSLSDKKSVNIQNLDIKNTKVVTNVSFNVYGKWNNNGEFTASDGTVKIVEGGTISGNNNFASFVFEKNGGKLSFDGKNSYKSLSIVAPGGEIKFAPGEENEQSVTESLILRGSKDSLMQLSSLPSSRNASQWFINCSNSEAADMRFIKVFDSYANKATSARLVALESRNGGNNINWQFPGLAIALTAAAIGQNQMYIVFDRAIDIAKSKLENTLYFINSEGSLLSDLKIQKATAIHNSTESTGFACSLSRTIQFEDILNVYVIYRSDGENYIATPTSDFMSDNESHALSDFAVNAVEPLYAYDNRQASLNSDYFKTGINIEESLAVHDWNEEQQKNGSLIYNSDIFIKVRKNYSTRLENSDKTTEKISLYFDTEPDKDASSAYYNSIFGEKLRVWLPSVTSEGKSVLPIEMMARKNNVPKGTLTAESENSEFKYNFDNDSLSMSNGINSGAQVKFIFGLEDREICRAPIVTGDLSGFTVNASNKSPLFALRLKNSKDISSLDLWSFRLKEITSQRGGVTILNNVIDTSRGDIATVKVDMSGSGSLSVIVMTLDGNVVQYLQHGTASGGEHYYSWNGKTKGGKNVARGMYFVRVIGSGFDETRKIMVVRE